MQLILASTSTYKQQLLSRLGVEFEISASHVTETHVAGEQPVDRAKRLAREKAQACAGPETISIGADQVIALGSRVFDKPGTVENAFSQLRQLRGNTHQLHCAVATVSPRETLVDVVSFDMVMRDLSDARLKAYVELDQPVDCAGAYKIESSGIGLFERLSGDDYTAIIGLPLTVVQTHLTHLGFYDL